MRISSPTKVLIVDDSSPVRQIVQKILQRSVFNCEISEASNGGDAALLQCSTTSCASTSCFLTAICRLSGLATLKRLRLIQPSLNIVMISAEHNAADESKALDDGACAFLHKPFSSQDVDQVLHAAFGLRSPT